jgi:hypothetical protein
MKALLLKYPNFEGKHTINQLIVFKRQMFAQNWK